VSGKLGRRVVLKINGKDVRLSAGKMHADEVETDMALVGRLLAEQFRQWAELPIAPVPSAGTDNALYRLGDDLVVRLPRIHWAIGQVEKEQQWLPRLAPQLPLAIPAPLAMGEPGEGYPWRWSVYRWLVGENATRAPIEDMCQAAIELAGFIAALQNIDPTGGPPPGPHNVHRGVPLAARDASTRESIAALREDYDAATLTAIWDAALQAPEWRDRPVWIHGDLQSGNLLVRDGRISAVIDFGCLGVGDPACDVMVAWSFLSGEARDVFRAALQVDDATWERGRGWALSCAVGAVSYYRNTNPVLAGIGRFTITQVLADRGL
jgi:aminoglycoside phosphotransferase (APT) family kinase protein